jgi:nucleotide-binding universal stress UspA family protein
MFERILLPLDGSRLAEAALPLVRKILERKDAEVVLLRALPPPPMVEGDFGRVAELDRKEAEAYLETVQNGLDAQGVRTRVRIREGPAPAVILTTAEEERATMIAMATHGRTGAARWLFGSVAEEVLRSAPVPLLLARSFPAAGRGELPKRILVPLDPGELSLEAVGPAAELAGVFGAHVVLLHVMPEGPAFGAPVVQITEAFERFRTAGLTVEPVLRRGDPAAEILSVVHDQKADLVAMATHGRAGVARMMFGSVAEKVLRKAEVPLLLVRGPRASSAPSKEDAAVGAK